MVELWWMGWMVGMGGKKIWGNPKLMGLGLEERVGVKEGVGLEEEMEEGEGAGKEEEVEVEEEEVGMEEGEMEVGMIRKW